MRYDSAAVAERLRGQRFERLVRKAVGSLPAPVAVLLDNVEIVIEGEPAPTQKGSPDEELFGLYEGVPLTERDTHYGLTTPDKITLFRGPLERNAATDAELFEEIRVTVIHEVSHHFGLDEDRIRDLGYE